MTMGFERQSDELRAEAKTYVNDNVVRLFGMALCGEGGSLGFNHRTMVEIHDWTWVNDAFRLAAESAVYDALKARDDAI